MQEWSSAILGEIKMPCTPKSAHVSHGATIIPTQGLLQAD